MAEAVERLLNDVFDAVRRLSDDELVAQVRSLAARERRETALLVAHLAELGDRELHLEAGYSSLFVYCRDALALSEHESYNRIEAARAARRFPAVLDLLTAGAVNLTTVRLLAPHLTPANHRGVLEEARGKKKSEVEEIVARLAPLPEPPPFVRRLPAPAPVRVAASPVAPAPRAAAAESGSGVAAAGPCGVGAGIGHVARNPEAAAPSPDNPFAVNGVVAQGAPRSAGAFARPAPSQVTPLAPDRYRFQLTITGATLEKLRLAKDMLRHAIPTGDEARILDRALDALRADLARAKFAATASPGAPRPSASDSRHVPAEVKRAVWIRDLGRCAFMAADGRRCNERAFVEFHHLRPYAVGGPPTAENIQLRCRRHNGYEARLFFAASRERDSGVVREPSGRYTAAPRRATVLRNTRPAQCATARRSGAAPWCEVAPAHEAAPSCAAAGSESQARTRSVTSYRGAPSRDVEPP